MAGARPFVAPEGADAPKPNTTWDGYVAQRKAPFGTLWLELDE